MKFFSNKENIIYAIQMVQRAVSMKSPLPVLTGILFECSDNMLKLTGTDTDLTISCTIPVITEIPGAMVFPSKYITEFSRKLPDGDIEIEKLKDSNMATIRYGQSEFNINGYNAAEFSIPEFQSSEVKFKIASESLKEIIKQVIFASSNDETRPVFTGVLIEIEENILTLVATDTFRLALRKLTIDKSVENLINVIVPGKTLNETARILGSSKDVTCQIGKSQILFKTEDTVILSRLINGRFPSYRQVIPEKHSSLIKVNLGNLLDAAERAALLVVERNPLVVFIVEDSNILVNVRSENGWIREKVPAETNGEKLEIYFNVKYLCDVLRSCNYEEIYIKLTGAYTPAMVTPVTGEEFVSILVPARPARSE